MEEVVPWQEPALAALHLWNAGLTTNTATNYDSNRGPRCCRAPHRARVPIQIAHVAGAGGYEPAVAAALGVFVDAIGQQDGRMKNVLFDVTAVVDAAAQPAQLEEIAARIRLIGVGRILYGSDAAATPAAFPEAGWAAFRRLPLTAAEFDTIAAHIAPYMRD